MIHVFLFKDWPCRHDVPVKMLILFCFSVQAQFSQLRPPAIATPVAPRMPMYPPGAPGLGQQLFYGQGPPAIIPPQVIAIFLSSFFMFNFSFVFALGSVLFDVFLFIFLSNSVCWLNITLLFFHFDLYLFYVYSSNGFLYFLLSFCCVAEVVSVMLLLFYLSQCIFC
jgi:hypothetical protein